MQLTWLFDPYQKLQHIHGDKNLDPIYGCGQIKSPKVCLIFMNPTAKNVSSHKQWKGLKAPWIGTKNIWKMLAQLGLIKDDLAKQIAEKKPSEWNYDFANKVYSAIAENSIYITNLSKATQIDARHLPNSSFQPYLPLLNQEIKVIKPKAIITFGGQVSSIFLGKPLRLSEYRKRHDTIIIDNEEFKVYPIFYPVGQGMRNMPIAKEDINWVLEQSK